MTTPLLKVSSEGGVGLIELAQPDKFNCLSSAVFKEVSSAFDVFESDGRIRAVLLCAQGKNFCTGADLEELHTLRGDPSRLRELLELGHHLLNRIEDSRLPVVAAAQGLSLAGGLELLLACDVVIAGKSARFGDQHGAFGLVPGWGGSQRLPRTVGQRRALDLFLNVRWIDADRAEAWGLVNYVVEERELRPSALAMCAKIASRSASGMALMKRLARAADGDAMRNAQRAELEAVIGLLMSADATEGLEAFRQRRVPAFS